MEKWEKAKEMMMLMMKACMHASLHSFIASLMPFEHEILWRLFSF